LVIFPLFAARYDENKSCSEKVLHRAELNTRSEIPKLLRDIRKGIRKETGRAVEVRGEKAHQKNVRDLDFGY